MGNRILLFITGFFLTCVAGCNNRAEQPEALQRPANAEDNIKVTLELVMHKDDTLSLYYTKDGSINFEKNDPLWASVKGNPTVQQVVYELPPGVLNPQIRLDFGNNPNQEDIVPKKIIFAYNEKTFEPSGSNIFDYFRPDPTKCKVDIDEGKIRAKYKDGIRQNPSLYPHEKLLAKRLSLLTGKK